MADKKKVTKKKAEPKAKAPKEKKAKKVKEAMSNGTVEDIYPRIGALMDLDMALEAVCKEEPGMPEKATHSMARFARLRIKRLAKELN